MMSNRIKHVPIPIPMAQQQQQQQQVNEQYSLTNQVFDPFSSSPPNVFISKLKKRMSSYNLFMNETNRKSE